MLVSYLRLPKSDVVVLLLPVFAALLYTLGIKFLFVPVIVATFALQLPFPKPLRSFTSRLAASMIIFYGLSQLVFSMQFFVIPHGGYRTTVWLLTIVGVLLVLSLRPKERDERVLITREDLSAVLAGLFFVVPISLYVLTGNSLKNITSIGSIQGNDGATHYAMISEAATKERMTYVKGAIYYPNGFHLTTGLVEDSLGIAQPDLGWQGNAWLYMAQYAVSAFMLSYIVFYLCLRFYDAVKQTPSKSRPNLLLAISLGVPLTLLYTMSFLYHGFINYFYICATIACGLLFLTEHLYTQGGQRSLRTPIFIVGLLLFYGASASWPLYMPVLSLVALALGFEFLKNSFKARNLRDPRAWLVLLGFAISLIPIYMQLTYAAVTTSEGLNAVGSLRDFQVEFLVSAVGLILFVVLSKNYSLDAKNIMLSVFAPFILFIFTLAAYQYFTVGEVRYYVIKVTIAFGLLLLPFVVAAIVGALSTAGLPRLSSGVMLGALPTIIFALLLAANQNPLKDMRDLFRSYSGQVKPAYFDSDIALLTEIGSEEQYENFNVFVLHHDKEKNKFFAHPQSTYWAGTISFGGHNREYAGKDCHHELYLNLLVGTFGDGEQAKLIRDVRKCAETARQQGLKYFIVTDSQSIERLGSVLPDSVQLVY